MGHPFLKIFDKALKKSTSNDNFVLIEAEKLIRKGYRETEVTDVLKKLQAGLIDDTELAIVEEALLELKS